MTLYDQMKMTELKLQYKEAVPAKIGIR